MLEALESGFRKPNRTGLVYTVKHALKQTPL